nr:MAG TPA: hypothetical protein [Caudoviricetes sp.]
MQRIREIPNRHQINGINLEESAYILYRSSSAKSRRNCNACSIIC